jgi:myo-inositol-1(or 4)-monophosphatase
MPEPFDLRADAEHVARALEIAREILLGFTSGSASVMLKEGGDPVTDADRAVNTALAAFLPRPGEAWLSEESADDASRLEARRVWVVDPLDGTREFVMGLKEWAVSVALVIDGAPLVGGVCNPGTGDTIVGAVGLGVTNAGRSVSIRPTATLDGAEVLASRSEYERGEWTAFADAAFEIRPCGSVAYKLALVAAGQIDATWTLVPKHEWDVAAGVALVRAAGGAVWIPGGGTLSFNNRNPKLPALAASTSGLHTLLQPMLDAELATQRAARR